MKKPQVPNSKPKIPRRKAQSLENCSSWVLGLEIWDLGLFSHIYFHFISILFLFFSPPLPVFSQDSINNEDSKEGIIEQRIEDIAENAEDEDGDYSELVEDLDHFLTDPLNLNRATREDLESLQLLTEMQIANLLAHIQANGKLILIYELQSIDGFDVETIQRIRPFVKVSPEDVVPRSSLAGMIHDGRSEMYFRYQNTLEEMAGFAPADSATLAQSPNSRYLGSKPRLYARYRFKYGNRISVGITGEKDSGEEFFKGSQKNGFDFYSAHFYLKDFGFLKTVAIGDFNAQFGQGLTFWSGYAMRKSSDALHVAKNGAGLKPYTSVDENLFLRGGGITLGAHGFTITSFGSLKKIDANISIYDSLDEEVAEVSSFQITGYHSTPAEIADKDAVEERIMGGNFSYSNRWFHYGITAAHAGYSAELNRNLSVYNQFEFTGSENSVLGTDYSITFRNLNMVGEFSRSQNGGLAFLNGGVISLDPRASFSVFYRNYQPGYQPIVARAFGENSKNANEEGLYFGMSIKFPRGLSFSGFYDNMIFHWLKFGVDAPSYGSEYRAQLNYTPSKKFDMYVRFRQKDKFKNNPASDAGDVDFIVPYSQINYRFNISYQVTPFLRFRNRIELLDYSVNHAVPQKGFLIYHDVIVKPHHKPYSVIFRYALFDTDNYDTRIYVYENDLPGVFSVPSLYYRGGKTYIMLRWRLIRHVDLWLRYSRIFFTGQNVIIGSALNGIEGNHKSEIKAQLRFTF